MSGFSMTRATGNKTFSNKVLGRCRMVISTDNIEVPIPEEDKAQIYTIGGVRRHLQLNFVINDGEEGYIKLNELVNEFIVGKLGERYLLTIESWGIANLGCVVNSIDIEQRAGETNVYTITFDLIIGEPM
jgi:hypothetical protein